MTRKDEYSDHQIRTTRAAQEKQLGRPMNDEEQLRNFGRIIPREGDSGTNSSRTIHVDGASPVDTSKSGRHAKPGIVSRFLRKGR